MGYPSKHKTFVLCLQNILPNIFEILLKMFINIKTFGLKIITIMFLIIFLSLFSKHFQNTLTQYCKNYSLNVSKKYLLILKRLA